MKHSVALVLALGALAHPAVLSADDATPAKFELRDGDRVVFLGNTLIEREQKYGHWETMLTARHPDRNITFRNLGWDGDTVWAESRGYFDAPQVGYQRLLDHIRELQPTVIFLGYGNNEAFAGEEGLPRFIEQYNKLLDDLTKAAAPGVRFVIVSPMAPESHGAPRPDLSELKAKIARYSSALRDLASRRGIPFVDLFAHFGSPYLVPQSTEDGLHLHEMGYFEAAGVIERQLFGNESRRIHDREQLDFALTADGAVQSADGADLSRIEASADGLRFQVRFPTITADRRILRITGLPAGAKYVLKVDGTPSKRLVGASRSPEFWHTGEEWSRRVEIFDPSDSTEYERLRKAVVEKNRLYFHHWRPQNITYLFGFRKHEQGQNAREVEQFERLVTQKEAEIARLRKPQPHLYEIRRLPDGTGK